MIKIRILIEKIGTGPIITIIIFLSMLVALLAANGFTFFPFIADPKVRKTLMLCLMLLLWIIVGIVLLVRREKGFLGFIISLFAILLIIITMSLAFYPIYFLITGK
jgi:hypothetical protein